MNFEDWWDSGPKSEYPYDAAKDAWEAATALERERCARVALDMDYGYDIAAAIRTGDVA
jgi:hypothetical protein